jgi:hypothetical protein
MAGTDRCPTVEIYVPEHPDKRVVMNAADFDEKVHVRFEEYEKTRGRNDDPRNADGKRTNGPTIEEWVKAGYRPEHYPPGDYAEKPSPGLDAYRAEQAAAAAQREAATTVTPASVDGQVQQLVDQVVDANTQQQVGASQPPTSDPASTAPTELPKRRR